MTADIRPGRRPTGVDRSELVRSYQQRAGITPSTGTEVLSAGVPDGPAPARPSPGGSKR